MSLAEDIQKLDDLKQNGTITEQEFQEAKEVLLARSRDEAQAPKQVVGGIQLDTNMWGLLIHLSQFANCIVPSAGLVLPIVLWQVKKDESAILDQHGKIVANWIISALIYTLVSLPLCFVIIGIPLLIAVVIAGIVFPIIGAVKAKDGEVWRYPCSMTFFK